MKVHQEPPDTRVPRHRGGADVVPLLGGAEGNRTPDLLIANETRYQLRHSPKVYRRLQTVAPAYLIFRFEEAIL